MSALAPVWSPTKQQAEGSRLWQFIRQHHCASYEELCQKAARDPDWFWDALVKALGIVWSAPYQRVMDTSAGLPFTRWFPGGLLNAYESAVVAHRRSDPDRVAIIGEVEAGTTRQLTYAQLEEVVERTAAGLRAIGVGRGVAVGLYLPLVIENAVALLACTKLGAVAVPLFSGFGAEAIRQRLADADARVLITADGAIRRGRPVAMKPVADQAAAGLPHLDRLVVVTCAGIDVPSQAGRDVAWDELAGASRVPTCDDVRERIAARYGELIPSDIDPELRTGPAKAFRIPGAQGTVGFITPLSHTFCAECNRLRLTSDGKLRYCLFAIEEADVKTLLRNGASNAEIEKVIRGNVREKWIGHEINSAKFVPPPRPMYSIGG